MVLARWAPILFSLGSYLSLKPGLCVHFGLEDAVLNNKHTSRIRKLDLQRLQQLLAC